MAKSLPADPAVAAHVLDMVGPDRLDDGFVIEGNGDDSPLLPGVLGGHKILPAILDPLDWAADDSRGQGHCTFFAPNRDLLAEAATDVVNDGSYVGAGQVEEVGEVVTSGMGALRRDPNRQLGGKRLPARQPPPGFPSGRRHSGAARLSRC